MFRNSLKTFEFVVSLRSLQTTKKLQIVLKNIIDEK